MKLHSCNKKDSHCVAPTLRICGDVVYVVFVLIIIAFITLIVIFVIVLITVTIKTFSVLWSSDNGGLW